MNMQNTSTTTPSLSADMVKDKIMSAKGNFVKVRWKSNPKPAAKFKAHNLQKVCEGVVRAGIDYSNLKTVKEGIENGERGEVQELPWGTWKEFPYIIEHKGTEYLRLYPSPSNKIKTVYMVDGEEVDKDVFCTYLTGSDAKKILNPSENEKECFNIKADNVLEIPQDYTE